MTHPVDAHVGQRIRWYRWVAGMSQQQLADAIGVHFQQIQKYETGLNRVPASRLWQIGAIMGIPVSSFFKKSDGQSSDNGETGSEVPIDGQTARLISVMRVMTRIQRRRFIDLARTLGDAA